MSRPELCDALVHKGTGYGVCGAPLDEYGNCPRAGFHVEE